MMVEGWKSEFEILMVDFIGIFIFIFGNERSFFWMGVLRKVACLWDSQFLCLRFR